VKVIMSCNFNKLITSYCNHKDMLLFLFSFFWGWWGISIIQCTDPFGFSLYLLLNVRAEEHLPNTLRQALIYKVTFWLMRLDIYNIFCSFYVYCFWHSGNLKSFDGTMAGPGISYALLCACFIDFGTR